ncbi:PadR family transcriptional regulator [Lacticaseibacillus pantheris]|uniref:PadR family transcriptional regulator n=1 Tax=Lacticaseibacillus pantheris TaxID=171523 RepID=UPI0026595149|nr:PadR family transcriptional regulator [Lacticaseibacillus pantheris]WKF85706.1 PadR family transcriptional regulator [Lacticaseibacillus pantheris]
MKQSQLLKGVLEGCVLLIIGQGEIYGYELMQRLHAYGFTSVVGGTLYPLLTKLETQGQIAGNLRTSPDGPDRKYFRLTTSGVKAGHDFERQWAELRAQVAAVVEDKNK